MSDLTVAISAPTVQAVFKGIVDKFVFEHVGAPTGGAVSVSYDVKFHFRSDTLVHPMLELKDDGSVFLHNLKILWDKLELTIAVDIPEICVGGFCLIPNPFDGCILEAPKLCIFGGHPDFTFTLAIDQFVTSEISVEGSMKTIHFMNPDRLPADTDWTAHANNRANSWKLAIDPQIIHVDPFHLADIVGDLFKHAITDNIDSAISSWPGWAKDLINLILGGIEDIIRVVLNLGDDVVQWLEGVLNGPVGLVDVIITVVTDFLLDKAPFVVTEDPAPVPDPLASKPPPPPPPPNPIWHPVDLQPLMVPIAALTPTVNSHEIVLEGTLG